MAVDYIHASRVVNCTSVSQSDLLYTRVDFIVVARWLCGVAVGLLHRKPNGVAVLRRASGNASLDVFSADVDGMELVETSKKIGRVESFPVVCFVGRTILRGCWCCDVECALSEAADQSCFGLSSGRGTLSASAFVILKILVSVIYC